MRSGFVASRSDTASVAAWLVIVALLLATALSVAAFVALDRPPVPRASRPAWLTAPQSTERALAKLEQPEQHP